MQVNWSPSVWNHEPRYSLPVCSHLPTHLTCVIFSYCICSTVRVHFFSYFIVILVYSDVTSPLPLRIQHSGDMIFECDDDLIYLIRISSAIILHGPSVCVVKYLIWLSIYTYRYEIINTIILHDTFLHDFKKS